MISYHSISSSTYALLRYQMILQFESGGKPRLAPYVDPVDGNVTIGAGFNIEGAPKNLEAIYTIFGIGPNETSVRSKILNAIQTISITSDLQRALNKIMADRASSLGTGRTTFAFANEQEVEKAFELIASNYETSLDNKVSVPINTMERLALISLEYNSNPSNPLIGQGIINAINGGDRAEAFYEIRFNSNGNNLSGIAKRRYEESEIFGLYGSAVVSTEDSLLAMRMFTKHERQITVYDKRWASERTVANTELGMIGARSNVLLATVSPIRDELEAARETLINDFGGGGQFDNVWVAPSTSAGSGEVAAHTVDRRTAGASRDLIIGSITSAGSFEDATDYLYGGAGDDVLIGGKGADFLDGGAGNDILWSGENDQPDNDGVDHLTGGSGKDTFHLNGDHDVVTDAELGETTYVNGKIKTGGTSSNDNPNVYYADDGTSYTYVNSPDSGGSALLAALSTAASAAAAGLALQITEPDGSISYVENFTNGDGGIWLRRPDQKPDPEKFASPLVLDLNGDGIDVTPLGSQQTYFDFGGDGFREWTGWVAPDDGFLALDCNGNGKIDDASELFGANPTDFEELALKPGGMETLAALDSNHDGMISSADVDFSKLLVWRDANQDGITDEGELSSLADLGIVSINLHHDQGTQPLADGYITEQSSFGRTDGSTGEIGDVWFKTDPTAALATEDVAISDSVAALPQIGGSGTVRDLQSAMQLDPLLQEMVQDLTDLDPSNLWQAAQKIEAILLRWTGADQVAADSRGGFINAQYLTAVECWTGDDFVQQAYATPRDPYPQAAAALVREYRELLATTTVKLLTQIPAGSALLPDVTSAMDAFLIPDADFSPQSFVDRATAQSPTDEYQQILYWKGVVTVAEALVNDAGVDETAFKSAIDSTLASIDPKLSYDILKRMIVGTDGNDHLTGTSTELDEDLSNPDPLNWTIGDVGGIDYFLGGAGDDVMNGGYGRDTYMFGVGAGHDLVLGNTDRWYDATDQDDVVQLIGGLALNDIQTSIVTVGGKRLARITVTATGDTFDFDIGAPSDDGRLVNDGVRIVGSDGTAEDFGFASGAVTAITNGLTLQDLQFERPEGTYVLNVKAPDGTLLASLSDYFSSTSAASIGFTLNGVSVSYEDIDIERLRRAETAGDDRITDTPRSNVINAGAGNDFVDGGRGDDTIDGGAGADVLKGDRGNDTYVFGRGSGVDTIIDPFGANVLEFGPGISLTDLQLSYGPNGNDLFIRVAGTQDLVSILGEFGVADGGISQFRFADGSIMSRSDIQALLPAPLPNPLGVLNLGTNGVDTLGATGQFTVAAGLGGQDIYQFNRGDGIMWVADSDIDNWNPSHADIIQFGAGIAPGDLSFRMVPSDISSTYLGEQENSIEIAIKGTSDAIRIQYFSPYWYYQSNPTGGSSVLYRSTAIGELRFADGQSMGLDQIFAQLQKGTDGDDIIRAWTEGAVIDGGAGNDILSPGDGGSSIDDVSFKFGRNSGDDTITWMGTSPYNDHKVLFDSDISPSDLSVSITANPNTYWSYGFKISIAGSDSTLTIPSEGSNASFVFGDGTVMSTWDMARVAVDQATQGPGGDIQLYAESENGYSGSEIQTVHLRAGMGERAVIGRAPVDIEAPAGLSISDLQFAPVERNGTVMFRIGFGDGGDAVLLSQLPSNLHVVDAVGDSVSGNQIFNQMVAPQALGTASDDLLIGTSGNDLFDGKGGADTIQFGSGSGQDLVLGYLPGDGYSQYHVKLAPGTALDDLTLQFDDNGFAHIGVAGSSDTLSLAWSSVLDLEADDGTIWTPDQLAARAGYDLNPSSIQSSPGDDSIDLPNGDLLFGRGDGHDDARVARVLLTDVNSLDELEFSFSETPIPFDPSSDEGPFIKEDGDVETTYKMTIRDTGDSITFSNSLPNEIVSATGQVLATPGDIDQLIVDRQETSGDDVVTAPTGAYAEFDGGPGNDVLNGYLGDSVYHFGRGDGTDTILENGWWFDGNYDVIEFKDGVAPSDVQASLDSKGDVILAIKGTDDKLIIPSLVNRVFQPGIEEVQFSDGTSWSMDDVIAPLLTATSGDDVIFDTYGDGETPDRYTQAHSNLLDGGAGNDFLAGGAGSDFYVFGRGYGQDTIMDKSPVALNFEIYGAEDYSDSYPAPEKDTLTFLPGITPDDLEFTRGGTTGNDLIIKIKGTTDQVTIIDEFDPLDTTGDRLISEYRYEWQTVDKNGNGRIDPDELAYVPLRYLASSPNGIESFRFSSQQELSLNDITALVNGTDNSGDNQYWTTDDGGTLDGGPGDDTLTGGRGNDDYDFARGDGNDTIHDLGGDDMINFGVGIREEQLRFSRVGADLNDLFIEIDGPERNTITVQGQFAQVPGVIEEFSFLTGETLTWVDVQNIILAQDRTSGDDTILGFLTDDVIDGGEGNDTLIGGKGNDTLIGGAGRDTAVFSGNRSDYSITQAGDAVQVTDLRSDGDGTDTLYDIEELRFGSEGSDTLDLVAPDKTPTASPLSAATIEEQQLTIARGTFIAGGSDPDSDPLDLARVGNSTGGRVWINLAGDVVFEPATDFFGTAGFDYILSDGKGGEGTGRVTVDVANVNDPPRLTGIIQDVEVDEDTPVDFTLPAGLFADPDGDPLTLGAMQSDGSALPSWLSFSQGRFTGTPPTNFNSDLNLLVSASDGTAAATAPFSLIINPVNDAPIAAQQIPDAQAIPGGNFDFSISDGAFTDVDGDQLELTAMQADGSDLPDWLLFDGEGFHGLVPGDFSGSMAIQVTATDGLDDVSQGFSIVAAAASNSAPVLTNPLADISLNEDQPVSVTLPANVFTDPDGDPLTLSLSLANGDSLPSWLTFSGTTITGQPPANFNGNLSLLLTASDGSLTASQTFELTIAPVNDAPVVNWAIADAHSPEDSPVDIELPADTFTDVDGDTLSLSATLANGEPLPSWLSFSQDRFTGTPPANFNGFFDIQVSASDGQASSSSTFRLTIDPVNDAPAVANPLADASASEGDSLSIAIPAQSFTDVDEDPLSYSATLTSGAALPSWLAFQNRTFSGTIPYDAAGTYDIRVTASDGLSAVSDDFKLTIANTDRAPVANDDSLFVTLRAQTLLIMASDVIANDSDPDGDPLTVTSVSGASHGTVQLNSDGNILYTPDGSYMGSDSFTYLVSDGSKTATAHIAVRVDDPFANWSLGTDGQDNMYGNMQTVNHLYALGSDDHIKGGQLDDYLAGGTGNDDIQGLDGNDQIWGMEGNDHLVGNNGIDTAHYFGLRSSFSITTSNGSVEVVDNAPLVDGDEGTDTILNIEMLMFKGGETISVNSPIILDLDGAGIQTVSASKSAAAFDMDGDGIADDTSWIGSTEGFLFLDRDGNGTLSGVNEMSFTADVPGAATDLAGLKAFDSNGDGILSAADSRFSDFKIWRDANGNGIVDDGEVLSLDQIGLTSINLSGTPNNSHVEFGDVAIVNNGSWTRSDGATLALADADMTFFSGRGSSGPPAHGWSRDRSRDVLSQLRQQEIFGGVWFKGAARQLTTSSDSNPRWDRTTDVQSAVSATDSSGTSIEHDQLFAVTPLATMGALLQGASILDKDSFVRWAHLLGATRDNGTDLPPINDAHEMFASKSYSFASFAFAGTRQ